MLRGVLFFLAFLALAPPAAWAPIPNLLGERGHAQVPGRVPVIIVDSVEGHGRVIPARKIFNDPASELRSVMEDVSDENAARAVIHKALVGGVVAAPENRADLHAEQASFAPADLHRYGAIPWPRLLAGAPKALTAPAGNDRPPEPLDLPSASATAQPLTFEAGGWAHKRPSADDRTGEDARFELLAFGHTGNVQATPSHTTGNMQ